MYSGRDADDSVASRVLSVFFFFFCWLEKVLVPVALRNDVRRHSEEHYPAYMAKGVSGFATKIAGGSKSSTFPGRSIALQHLLK